MIDLDAAVRQAPLWRPNGTPLRFDGCVLVCYKDDLPALPDTFPPAVASRLAAISVIGVSPGALPPIGLAYASGETVAVPQVALEDLAATTQATFVFFCPTYHPGKLQYGPLSMQRKTGYRAFFVMTPMPGHTGMRIIHDPGYLDANRADLLAAYALLADADSRAVFAGRVRAVLTGQIGYMPVSAYPDYFHPEMPPGQGATILDGGISADISSQLDFVRAIGPTGRVFGFEPDPQGRQAAQAQLVANAAAETVTLVPLGLWNAEGTLRLVVDGMASRVVDAGHPEGIDCPVTTINRFVTAAGLSRVDMIKLDIEGAELAALRGALRTLVRHKPALAISVYHKPEDLFEIPLFLHKLGLGYRFHLGHHRPSLLESVLYAHVPA